MAVAISIADSMYDTDDCVKVRLVAHFVGMEVRRKRKSAERWTSSLALVNETGTERSVTTNAALRLLGRRGDLMGRSEWNHALVDQWLEFVRSTLDVPTAVISVGGRSWCNAKETASIGRATGAAKRMFLSPKDGILQYLDRHFSERTFLVGERISVADLSMAVSLCAVFSPPSDLVENIETYPHLRRWLNHILRFPSCVDVLGPPETRPFSYDPPSDVPSWIGERITTTATEESPCDISPCPVRICAIH